MKYKSKILMAAALVAAAALPVTLRASTIMAVSFDELVQQSELVFEGQVVAEETRRSKLDGSPFTYFTFQVLDVIKGNTPAGGYLTLGFAGGTIDGLTMEVHDLRMPVLNEKGIYFVETLENELLNPFYGWQQGHYLVLEDASTGLERVVPTLGAPAELNAAPTVGDFKQSIRGRMGGAK